MSGHEREIFITELGKGGGKVHLLAKNHERKDINCVWRNSGLSNRHDTQPTRTEFITIYMRTTTLRNIFQRVWGPSDDICNELTALPQG